MDPPHEESSRAAAIRPTGLKTRDPLDSISNLLTSALEGGGDALCCWDLREVPETRGWSPASATKIEVQVAVKQGRKTPIVIAVTNCRHDW